VNLAVNFLKNDDAAAAATMNKDYASGEVIDVDAGEHMD